MHVSLSVERVGLSHKNQKASGWEQSSKRHQLARGQPLAKFGMKPVSRDTSSSSKELKGNKKPPKVGGGGGRMAQNDSEFDRYSANCNLLIFPSLSFSVCHWGFVDPDSEKRWSDCFRK